MESSLIMAKCQLFKMYSATVTPAANELLQCCKVRPVSRTVKLGRRACTQTGAKMTPHIPECIWSFVSIIDSNTLPLRDPNDDDEEGDEEGDDKDDHEEPAVVREPDE
jgi:hypothetical protein